MSLITILDFLFGKFTITISIHSSENFINLFFLLFRQKLRSNESISSLLKFWVSIEVFQIIQRAYCCIFIKSLNYCIVSLFQPWVLKSLLSRWSSILIEGKKLGNKIFALVRNRLPDWIIEIELSELYFFHNFLVRCTIKWRNTRQNNVSNDSDRPNIAFSTVILLKDFWSNVIWGSEFFIKFFTILNNKRCTEINDFNLIELFVSLKKNVLWFKISMNDVVFMAIVNASKNLINEHSSVFLSEFTFGNDFIE